MLSTHAAIRHLGESLGIEAEYTDVFGKVRRTSPEATARILEAKGIGIESALLSLDPSVMVFSSDQLPSSVSIYFLPLAEDEPGGSSGLIRIHECSGRFGQQEYALADSRIQVSLDEPTGVLQIAIPLPQGVCEGQYRVAAELIVGSRTFVRQCHWIVCPPRAFVPPELESGGRMAGVGIALYGVKSRRNWGVGDFRDLKSIIDWAKDDLGVDFVGLNPLHALFNRRPYNSSPYAPSSRLYRNFIYLDVPGIADFASARWATALVASSDFQRQINRLRDEAEVQYEDVAAVKLQVLREVFRSFMELHGTARTSERWKEFRSYCDSEGEYLERFATFCALNDHFRQEVPSAATWRDWPPPFRNATSPEVLQFRREHEAEALFWMYVQWQIDQQLRAAQQHAVQKGMRIGLYCDEALGVDSNGADFWAWQEFFHQGFSVGAPPDAFAPEGQDWGFAPPNSERIRATGYGWFLRNLKANCMGFGALRIDHVMQLCHLFWIPAGQRPRHGVYVRENEAELLSLLALVSQSSRTIIVGEDLGTVPYAFRERLMDKGLLSYRLFYFERGPDQRMLPADAYPEAALVSITTHDLPTLAGFWSVKDVEIRQQIGDLDQERSEAFRLERGQHKAFMIERLVQDGYLSAQEGEVALRSRVPTERLHMAVLSFLFRTRCRLAMINQEDVFLDDRQQNFPGTTWQSPNWTTKMKFSVEELKTDPEAMRSAANFRKALQESGRVPAG